MRLSTSLALAALGLSASALPAAAGTLLVPQQFPTIQAALNAAKPYDTVLVSAKPKGGVYNEAVTITTPRVVLQGKNNPVIDGTGLGTPGVQSPFSPAPTTIYPNAVDIRASHVAVRGLTIQNTGSAPASPIIFGFPLVPVSSAVNVGFISQTASGPVESSYSDIEISGVTARNNVNGISIAGYAGSLSPFGTQIAGPLTGGYRLLGDTVSGSTGSAAFLNGTYNLQVTGSRFTGNAGAGLTVGGSNTAGVVNVTTALITGNVFSGNTGDGLDVYGDGVTVTANEACGNTAYGMSVAMAPATNYFPNPATNFVTLNSIHDNQSYGLSVGGMQTISGNLLSRNTGYGLYLNAADNSTVSYNLITGTVLSGQDYDDGTGIYADDPAAYTPGYSGPGGLLTISANAVDGNKGDGIAFGAIVGSTVSYNDASGNAGIGIHLSDFPSAGQAPNTVTLNSAVQNKLFDARDDSNAADDLTYDGYTSYGDNYKYGASINVWTKNVFGTTDPIGLSK